MALIPPPEATSAGGGVRPGTLYVVATPLGNLEDITLRALRVLEAVDLIAAEDTRHTRKLLAHYGIRTPLTSYYDHVERRRAPQLVEVLRAGRSIALVSDAGTPGIADPGYHLVCAAIAARMPVEPVPGPSAVIAALSASGLPTDRFAFEGFVPSRASARQRFFAALVREERTLVVYEAARRLPGCLAAIRDSLGDRPIVIVRELTKVFEEILRGRVEELVPLIERRASEASVRGEVTLLIGGAEGGAGAASAEGLESVIERLRSEGLSVKEISRVLARERGLSRRQVYQMTLAQAAGKSERRGRRS
jgi:16S rRNA (cytidine1402-2'-O)-methyltransferase